VTDPERIADWERAAPGWERRRSFVASVAAPVTTRLLELLQAAPGETVLELACGAGEVGHAVAAQLGDGRLVQTDAAWQMVAAAQREASRLAIENVEHRVLDAAELDLADATVDAIVCRFGYMLVEEPVRALAESRRVLRPGGRVALAVWAEAEHNPWGTVVRRALLEHDAIEQPPPDAPGPFRLGDRRDLEQAIAAAGLELVASETVAVAWRGVSVDEFLEISLDLSTTTAAALGRLPERRRQSVRNRVAELLSPYREEAVVVVPGLSHVALARRAPA
jgi:SAM-dependent methyltransferase